jgi:hypothetical protein
MLSVAGLKVVTRPEGNPWLAVAKQLGVVVPVAIICAGSGVLHWFVVVGFT